MAPRHANERIPCHAMPFPCHPHVLMCQPASTQYMPALWQPPPCLHPPVVPHPNLCHLHQSHQPVLQQGQQRHHLQHCSHHLQALGPCTTGATQAGQEARQLQGLLNLRANGGGVRRTGGSRQERLVGGVRGPGMRGFDDAWVDRGADVTLSGLPVHPDGVQLWWEFGAFRAAVHVRPMSGAGSQRCIIDAHAREPHKSLMRMRVNHTQRPTHMHTHAPAQTTLLFQPVLPIKLTRPPPRPPSRTHLQCQRSSFLPVPPPRLSQ